MLEAIAGAPLRERPIYSVTNCTVAPLQHDREMTEAHMLLAKAGVPVFVLPMPQMGTTGPMSVLGTSILNMAELLSTVVLFQLAVRAARWSRRSAPPSPRCAAGCTFRGPRGRADQHALHRDEPLLRLPAQGSGVSSDAKACNLQAGVEGMMTGLACVLSGADALLAFGLLDSAQTASLAKTVLDADTVNAIERFAREDPVDATTALIDDIVEVGIGGHYLARRSTRQRYRAGELWQPQLWQREPFERYAGRPLVKDAWDRAQALIAANDVPRFLTTSRDTATG
jgi:trimethylamine---corrinoid protein Co-methyltransferase